MTAFPLPPIPSHLTDFPTTAPCPLILSSGLFKHESDRIVPLLKTLQRAPQCPENKVQTLEARPV